MTWVLIGAVLIAAVVAISVLRSPYRVLFSDEHKLEFARAALVARKAALARIEEPDESGPFEPDDPRHFRTSRDVVVNYTVTRRGDRIGHHVSLSYGPQYGAMAPGRHFCGFLMELYGFPAEAAHIGVSQNRVFHLAVEHGEEGLAAMLASEPSCPTAQDVQPRWLRGIESVDQVEIELLQLPDGPPA